MFWKIMEFVILFIISGAPLVLVIQMIVSDFKFKKQMNDNGDEF